MRINPVFVTHLLGPFAVKLADRLAVVGIDPLVTGQAPHIFPVGFLGVAIDQALERGVGFNHGSIDPDIAAPYQPMVLQGLQDQQKDLLIDVFAQAGADDR